MPQTTAKLTGNRCKCRACGEVFSTERNFDKHRKGEYRNNGRHCVCPSTVGLRIREGSTGSLWVMNEENKYI